MKEKIVKQIITEDEAMDTGIFFMLVNTEKNRKILEKVPHREVMDLSVIYREALGISDGVFQSRMITDERAGELGFTEEELYGLALENTPKIMILHLINMDDVLFMVGNCRKQFGAAAMLYDGVLEALSQVMEGDLYILPSSIHEVFVVSTANQDLEELRKLVCHGNRNWVEDGGVLSHQIYHYDYREKLLGIAVQ